MGIIILLGIIGLIAVAAFGALFFMQHKEDRQISTGIGVVATVIFAVVFFIAAVSYPSQRTVGIVTEFGKPVDTISPGFNLTAPWSEVTEFPTSNQTLDLDASNDGPNVAAKFDGGSQGGINIQVIWKVLNDDKAIELWRNWKEFQAVTDNLVNPKVQSAVAEVFGRLTPEQAVKGDRLGPLNEEIRTLLNQRFAADGIEIPANGVTIKRVDLSPQAQERIDKQVQAQADLERSKIDQERARVDNETNALREQSLTPSALERYCLDVMNSWDVAKNGPLPAGFNCNGVGLPQTQPIG